MEEEEGEVKLVAARCPATRRSHGYGLLGLLIGLPVVAHLKCH